MQVYDFADDLKVSPDALIALLRQMGIPVADEDATISDAQVAKVLAKVEKRNKERFGKVTKVTDSEVEVELAQGIKVTAVKSTLTQVIDPTSAKPAND